MEMDGDTTLLITTSTGSHFAIVVNRSDTILQIKRKIERRQGIPIFYQNLHLPDHLRLAETTITHMSNLDLEVVRPEPLIDLFIRPSVGDAFFLSLQPRNVTIRQIKEKIQQITAIPITSQTLGFNLCYLPDHLRLRDTAIQDYSILDLIIGWVPQTMFPLQGYNLTWQPQQYQPGVPLFLHLTPQQQFGPQPSQPPQNQPGIPQQRPQHQSGPRSAHQRSQTPQSQRFSQPRPQHQSGRRRNSHQEMDSRQQSVRQPPRQAHQSGRQTNSHQEMDSRQQWVRQPPRQAPVTAASGSGNQTLDSHEIPDGSVIVDDLPSSAPESEFGSEKKN